MGWFAGLCRLPPCMTALCADECMIMDDQQIIMGLLQGSPAAADALIDGFAQPLIRYFAVHLPDPTQAEDMAQEVFLRFIGNLRRSSGAPPSVRSIYSLLFTIARHLAIDVTKAAKRRPAHFPLEDEDQDGDVPATGPLLVRLRSINPDPRAAAQSQQEYERLQQALRALPAESREVLVLRHIDELGAREISEILGIAEGTVWSRLNRGLHDLRREYLALTQTPSETIPATSTQSAGKRNL